MQRLLQQYCEPRCTTWAQKLRWDLRHSRRWSISGASGSPQLACANEEGAVWGPLMPRAFQTR
eukprot:4881835-Amphidinium_carterae.1